MSIGTMRVTGRSESYWDQLTAEEKVAVRKLLLESKESLSKLMTQVPVWNSGRFKGKAPRRWALRSTLQRLRAEETVEQIQSGGAASVTLAQGLEKQFPQGEVKGMLDAIMPLIAQEVMMKTLRKIDPAARTAAAQLLLKREDQILNREKIQLAREKLQMEAEARKQKETPLKDPTEPITEEMWERLEKELGLM